MTRLKQKWDMFLESVGMSLSNITSNKMRTFLTTLGIIIGVAAIIALMTVVQGATDTMNAQFDAMGLGTLRVSITGTALKQPNVVRQVTSMPARHVRADVNELSALLSDLHMG